MSRQPNTIGLGEYTNADLLSELNKRGVLQDLIGEMEYRETFDLTLKTWTNSDQKAFTRNNLRSKQYKLVSKLIGDKEAK